MVKKLLILILLFPVIVWGQWVKTLGGAGDDNIQTVLPGNSGNLFMFGELEGTVDFDPGPGVTELTASNTNSYYFVEYNSAGDLLNEFVLESDDPLSIVSMSIDSQENVIITGYFTGTMDFDPDPDSTTEETKSAYTSFFAKYDSGGDFIYVKILESTDAAYVVNVGTTHSDNILLSGYAYYHLDMDPGPGEEVITSTDQVEFLIQYTPDGEYIWGKKLVDDDVTGGTAAFNADEGGNVTILFNYSGDMTFLPNDDALPYTSSGGYDFVLARFDSAGNMLWAESIGGASMEFPGYIETDSENNIYIAGLYYFGADLDPGPDSSNTPASGGAEIFVAKYDSNGTYLWGNAIYSGDGQKSPGHFAISDDGFIYVPGSFMSTTDFDPGTGVTEKSPAGSFDIFVARYTTSDFTLDWVKTFGGKGQDMAIGSVLGENDNIVTVGFIADSADFNPETGETIIETNNASTDIFIMSEDAATGFVPVELVSFSAVPSGSEIVLSWKTATEANNLGFEIERSAEKKEKSWTTIGFTEGHGTSAEPNSYVFKDREPLAGNSCYRLKQIDTDGSYTYSAVIEVSAGAPSNYALEQNYPNPFNPATTIGFSLRENTTVNITIYNTLGEKVVTLVNKQMEAGYHRLNWNGIDAAGNAVSSGTYIYRLESPGFTTSRKMLLLK